MSADESVNKVGVELRLGPVSCLVLGMIGLRGPSTPYDLKKAAERSVSYFWPFPHSQLYGEPERLAKAGLLSREDEYGGRRRKRYALTEAGRKTLVTWLQVPPDDIFEMHDMAVLQLFFGEFMTEQELSALARKQANLYRSRLETYASIEVANGKRIDRTRRMAPLRLGIRLAEACRDFWDEIADDPPP
ncbi:PadR family transcriptional regulator AphA [Methylobacterium sp. OAE515]|uniref:helix-turn-helix transcriptional regulator n=1 Tax=Methylobacterium sp. OAE515 TaxID=2817895 RepID=UPI0017898702